MLKFYYNTAPNPMKVALFMEDSGLPYEPVPLDTRKGEQHSHRSSCRSLSGTGHRQAVALNERP
jgi:GST-like protein